MLIVFSGFIFQQGINAEERTDDHSTEFHHRDIPAAWTNWTNMFPGPHPPGRSGHTLVYDRNNDRVLIFGGYGKAYYNDLWAYDLKNNSWKNITPDISPPGRLDHGAAFDWKNGYMVIFGGRCAKGVLNDTWVYDYRSNTWANRSPVISPRPRERFGFTYDEESERVVLFGGMVENAYYDNETWVYYVKNDTWTNLTFFNAPKGRADHALEYDAGHDRILMYGGKTGPLDFTEETWIYDLNKNRWTEVKGGVRPGPKVGHAMAYDAKITQIIMFGGMNTNETWSFDMNSMSWIHLLPAASPFPRSEHAMGYDTRDERVVLFGGSNGGDEVWVYDALTVVWTNPDPTPTPRFDHAMTYDSVNREVIIFGGVVTGMTRGNDMWRYNPRTNAWAQITLQVRPSPRSSSGIAFDSRSERIILFGGVTPSGFDNETWAYDVKKGIWSEMHPVRSPPPMAYHSMAYDSQSDRVILFGGNTGSTLTWAYDFNTDTWTEMSPEDSPPARGMFGMVYDSQSDRIVLFGGNGSTGAFNDTWIYDYDNDTWTEMRPLRSPPAREQFAMVYDSQGDRVVLFGGMAGGRYVNDTWVYDLEGNIWEHISTQSAPTPRVRHAMSYDPETGRVVLFGGSDASAFRNGETWTCTPPGNEPPGVPMISGPSEGTVNVTLAYSIVAYDPEMENLRYGVDWGDGTRIWTDIYPSGESVTLTHAWRSPGVYRVTGVSIDPRGKVSSWSSPLEVKITSFPAPEVAHTSPKDGAVNVNLTPSVMIAFTQPMDRRSTEGAISNSANISIASKWSENDTVLEFVFTQPLKYNTTYTITISTDAKSRNLVPLTSSYTFSFTTRSAPELPDSHPPDHTLLLVISLVLLILLIVVVVFFVLKRKRGDPRRKRKRHQ